MPRSVYSSSGISSTSSSGSETEDFEDVLRSLGLNKKYGKLFAQEKIDCLEDARELSERKLKKLGVSSSSDRKKILKAIVLKNDSSSESSSDSDSLSSSSDSEHEEKSPVFNVLKQYGLTKHYDKLKRKRVTTLSTARKLTEEKLKEFGFESSSTRRKLLTAFKDRKSKSHSVTVKKSTAKKDKETESESKTIAKILEQIGFGSVSLKFEEHGIDSLAKARELNPTKLKSMGIDTLSARCSILNAFKEVDVKSQGSVSSTAQSSASKKLKDSASDSLELKKEKALDKAEENIVMKILCSVNLQKHFALFKERKLHKHSIRQLQELGHAELRDIGIENQGQRSLIIEALHQADWKCVYCHTWNEYRKTCVVCQKTFRVNTSSSLVLEAESGEEQKFVLEDSVKYVGRFRPTTRVKYGDKGKIHRILDNDCYMVKFTNKEKKTVTIRLEQSELVKTK